MITESEYRETLVRMWDSLRNENKGSKVCSSVMCEVCPLDNNGCGYEAGMAQYEVFEAIKTVEKWGKEHPIKEEK